jgi:hypothetical protein
MECGQWKEKDCDVLIFTIKHGNCILMLEPGMAIEQFEGQSRSLTEILAHELARGILPEDLTAWDIDPFNLVQVAQYYEIKKREPDLQEKAERFYLDRQKQRSDLHRDLAALPFALTLLSTPDDLFFNALQDAGKKTGQARISVSGQQIESVLDRDGRKTIAVLSLWHDS